MTIPWKSWLALFLVLAAAAWLLSRERRLRGDAERAAEAARLALEHQIVERESTRKELTETIAELLDQNKLLAAAFDDAMKVAPDAKPISASRLDTGPLEVNAEPPRPAQPAPQAQGCSLRPGDKLSVKVDVLELQTKAGNTILVGAAEVWRPDPPPPVLLASGKFESSLSASRELETPAPKRWGAYGEGSYGAGGLGLGTGVLIPPVTVPLLGWRLETTAGVSAEPAGVRLRGTAGFRF